VTVRWESRWCKFN